MFEIVMRPGADLVDFQAWDDFAQALTKVVEAAAGRIILDLTRVNRMSSNYIGTIISNFKTAKGMGKDLRLINVGPELYKILDVLNLPEMMPIERIVKG